MDKLISRAETPFCSLSCTSPCENSFSYNAVTPLYGYNEEHQACKLIKYRLWQLVEGIIHKKYVTHFLSGLAEGVDTWAAKTVLDIKDEHPNIMVRSGYPM